MENYKMDQSNKDNRDAQNAEEYTGSNANFNQNADANDLQNSNPKAADMENTRLDTDPNRYANYSTSDAEQKLDADETDESWSASEDERTQYSPEDERRLETRNASEENGNLESGARTSQDEDDSDKEEFFDGL